MTDPKMFWTDEDELMEEVAPGCQPISRGFVEKLLQLDGDGPAWRAVKAASIGEITVDIVPTRLGAMRKLRWEWNRRRKKYWAKS